MRKPPKGRFFALSCLMLAFATILVPCCVYCVMLKLIGWYLDDFASEDYYQEGSNVYTKLDVDEAFRKALTTWGQWVDKNVNPKKSLVFFRGYSPSHFRYIKDSRSAHL